MGILNDALMEALQGFQRQFPVPALAGLAACACRSSCSGDCDDSCSGSCDGSCAGSCDDSCAGSCEHSASFEED